MARKPKLDVDQALEEEPANAAASLFETWDSYRPGQKVVHGVFSLYKASDGGLHIAFRPDGAGEDQHIPIPPGLLRMARMAMEGRGPFGRVAAMMAGRMGG